MPDAFCTIIWENKSQDKSCVIIWSFFRDPSKLPNYVLLRQGQPCQSTQQRLPLPSKTVHSRFNGSQKFSVRQSDNVAQTNKVCFFSRFNMLVEKETDMPCRKIWLNDKLLLKTCWDEFKKRIETWQKQNKTKVIKSFMEHSILLCNTHCVCYDKN